MLNGFIQKTGEHRNTEPELPSVMLCRNEKNTGYNNNKVINSNISGNGAVKEPDTVKPKTTGPGVLPIGKKNKVQYTKFVAPIALSLICLAKRYSLI